MAGFQVSTFCLSTRTSLHLQNCQCAYSRQDVLDWQNLL